MRENKRLRCYRLNCITNVGCLGLWVHPTEDFDVYDFFVIHRDYSACFGVRLEHLVV